MSAKEKMQPIEILEKSLLPGNAADIVDNLVEVFIGWYNVHQLRQWESDHRYNTRTILDKIAELKAWKQNFKALAEKAKARGLSLEVAARIEVRLVKKDLTQHLPVESLYN